MLGTCPYADLEAVSVDRERGRPDQALKVRPSRRWRIREEACGDVRGALAYRPVKQPGRIELFDQADESLPNVVPRCPEHDCCVLCEVVEAHRAVEECHQDRPDRIHVVHGPPHGIEQQEFPVDVVQI